MFLASTLASRGQPEPGHAEVRAVRGTVTYATNGGLAQPLSAGTILASGTTLHTGPESQVDLFLGRSAGLVRVAEKTVLSLDKLTLEDTGADVAVEVQLDLPDGEIYFDVNKLSKASRYEVKMPNGVAGIRGTKGSFSFRPELKDKPPVVLLTGQVIFAHVSADGNVSSHVMNAPPAVFFSVTEGVQIAPDDLFNAVASELEEIGRPEETGVEPPPQKPPPAVPFLSPGAGTLH